MKSLYKYMLIGAAFSLTACNDSFLDRTYQQPDRRRILAYYQRP